MKYLYVNSFSMSLPLITVYSSQEIPIHCERLYHQDINLVNTKTEKLIVDSTLTKDYGRIDVKSDSNIMVTEQKMDAGYFSKELQRYRITSSYNRVLKRETQSYRYNQNFSIMGSNLK